LSQVLQTVLLSAGTSLIVSMITFILGLKSGKNQTDRAKLQGIYKQLYSHFADLKDALLRDCPKSWENYKKLERGLYSVEYVPPVKELKRTGDLLFVKTKIAKEALELEMRLMKYSNDLTQHIPDIHKSLISDLRLYCEGYTFKKYQGNQDETAHFETANPNGYNRFWSRNYRILYNKELTINMLKEIDKDSSCALELSSGGNPPSYSAKIYPKGLAVSVDEFAERIIAAFDTNVSEYNALCSKKEKLIAQIDSLNKKIEQRTREPVSFWETIAGAFADMFR
jgi:hypothetical protein